MHNDAELTPLERRRLRRRQARMRQPTKPARLILALLFVAVLFGIGFAYYATKTVRYVIVIGEKPLAALPSANAAAQAIQQFRQQFAPDTPRAVVCQEGELSVRALHLRMPIKTVEGAIAVLNAQVAVSLSGYALSVNRRPLVMVATQDDATRVISLMLTRGLAGRAGIPTFKERVTIAPYQYVTGQTHGVIPLLAPDRAAAFLVHPPDKNSWTVRKGDSFWIIATANGISVTELNALNPGFTHRKLHAGDRIALPDTPAPVTVVVRELSSRGLHRVAGHFLSLR